MRRTFVLTAMMTGALGLWLAHANDPPIPEARILRPIPAPLDSTLATPCAAEPGNTYEEAWYRDVEGWPAAANGKYVRYPGACQRLKFAFGPIVVKPGQNDVLIQPITIEKPAYDGYMVRFRPDLVRADGTVPYIEEVHLHHGTWLSIYPGYTSLPFLASGEEKTIGDIPKGYGFPVGKADTWQLLYMIHNLRPNPDVVWITYDVDFIAKDRGDALNLKKAYPIWLDVRGRDSGRSSYPVMNVQRGFGVPGAGKCTWPLENCAAFDPWGVKSYHQGGSQTNYDGHEITLSSNLGGAIPNFTGGSLVAIAGHLHPGGLTDTIDIVHNAGQTSEDPRRIFTSEAVYWNCAGPQPTNADCPPTGPPTSWDLSMTGTGFPRWAVKVKPGDTLRINATYDSVIQSMYEGMGIAVAMLAPDDDSGLDPFTAPVDTSATDVSACLQKSTPTLCTKGKVTHGHMAEANTKGGPDLGSTIGGTDESTTTINIAGFSFTQGDPAVIQATGSIPTVKMGGKLTFVNLDSAADIYHTVTSCKYPCDGATGIAYPLADGQADNSMQTIDFDSSELGYGVPTIGPAKQSASWDLAVTAQNGFEAGHVYTYFCRIHPFMRGAFKVVQ